MKLFINNVFLGFVVLHLCEVGSVLSNLCDWDYWRGLSCRISRYVWCLLLILCLVVFGCSHGVIGGLVPCYGSVTLDGVPLDGATIGFTPVNAAGEVDVSKRGGTAISNSNGHFTIKTASDSPGIAKGTYKVNVGKMVDGQSTEGKSPIPQSITGKYAVAETSDLNVEIPAGGNKRIKLELKLK
jgi:hypothetical protein